jgi:hypothetical protein
MTVSMVKIVQNIARMNDTGKNNHTGPIFSSSLSIYLTEWSILIILSLVRLNVIKFSFGNLRIFIRFFVPDRLFQPSLMFVGKARSVMLSRAP